MTRNYRVAAKLGHRVCNRCERELPATPEVFLRDNSRALGLAYECRECHRARKIGRDRRTERWANHTPEQRAKAQARQHRYNRSDRGRAVFLSNAYRRVDAEKGRESNISADFLLTRIFPEPCTYCGTTDEPRGCDRLDNAIGHTMENVVPCCRVCNFARGDRLTHHEMKRVGALIAEIIAGRTSS